MNRFLRQLGIFIYVTVFDLSHAIRNFWKVDVMKRHRRVHRETAGGQPQTSSARCAVVAVYPSRWSLPFTLNLLEALISADFWVLVVSTRKLGDDRRELLRAWCHHIVERENVGQDIGSYQFGIEWLARNKNLFTETQKLVLANDSMFYPKEFKNELPRMLEKPDVWQSLFENHEVHFHAQSFFLLFDREVFVSSAFRNFWKRYKPYSSRRHAINKGEVGLSQRLKKAGFVNEPAYSSVRLASALTGAGWRLSRLAELAPTNPNYDIERDKIKDSARSFKIFNLRPFGSGKTAPTEEWVMNLWIDRIVRRFELSNPTHAGALYCNVLLGAPIKRDVCYRGTYDMNQVVSMAQGFDREELDAIMRDLRARGLGAVLGGFRHYLWVTGRI
jgi:hypothetical protein